MYAAQKTENTREHKNPIFIQHKDCAPSKTWNTKTLFI